MKNIIALVLVLFGFQFAKAQDGKVSIYSGVGRMGGLGEIQITIHPSLALISGLDIRLSKRAFLQASAGFNALNYDQQLPDSNTELLIRKSKSNALMLGLNVGLRLLNEKKRINLAPYVGTGYLRLQEPRFSQSANNIVTQSSKFSNAILGRTGLYSTFNTKTALLQTVFLDNTLWATGLNVQGSDFKGYSIIIGTKIKM